MPLRFIARYIANHPEVIERLSNSYPFRRAAQLSAVLFFKGRDAGVSALGMASQYMQRMGFKPRKGVKFFDIDPPGKVEHPSRSGPTRQWNDEASRQWNNEKDLQRMKKYVDELRKKQQK